MGHLGNNTFTAVKRAFIVGLIAFFLAVSVGLGSQSLLNNISSLIIAFALLIIIILIGILFDIIGTAVTAAHETPFHAKAACKVSGAKQAIILVKNADRVANICNDVIGDVSASLSGAIGATIIVKILTYQSEPMLIFAGTIMTGVIAGLTVGGKAYGKFMAINESNDIIFQVGRFLYWLEKTFGITFLRAPSRKGRKNA